MARRRAESLTRHSAGTKYLNISYRSNAMSGVERPDDTVCKVAVNHEEQYSLWPADRGIPLGWRDAGKSGRKAKCLAYIKEVWTDMRPLSRRKKMEAGGEPPASGRWHD
jgi:MbtH protein